MTSIRMPYCLEFIFVTIPVSLGENSGNHRDLSSVIQQVSRDTSDITQSFAVTLFKPVYQLLTTSTMVQMDPCCGGSLQRGTKIVAIVEMVLSILTTIGALTLLLLSVWAISALSKDKSTSIQDSGHSLGNLPPNHSTDSGGDVLVLKVLIAASSGTLIVGIFGLVMSIILLKGSNQRNLRKCRVWFIIKCILMVAELAIFLVSVSSEPKGEQAVSLISIALGAYFMCVVFAFMKELREEQAALGTPKNFYKA